MTARPARSIALALLLCASAVPALGAEAADATGSGALALAALVGIEDPALPASDRAALAALLDGRADTVATAAPIVVAAGSVVCRAGNVDIAFHACDITSAGGRRSLSGRAAHALYATLLEDGVATDGAAGTIYATVRDLSCRIDPKEVAARDGGGAACRFKRDR